MKSQPSQAYLKKVQVWASLPSQVALLVVGISLLQFLLWYGIQHYHPIQDENPNVGFGDSFAPIATLFSGFAFAGVIWAILLQRKELQLQRQDLELTRVELQKSADAHEETVNIMKAEHDERRLQAQRAATLILHRQGNGVEYEDHIEVPLTNLGTVAFDVHLPESEDAQTRAKRQYAIVQEILNTGSTFTITFRTSKSPCENQTMRQQYGDREFTIEYIDSTGSERKQLYLCELDRDGYPVTCQDAGIGALKGGAM